MSHNFEASFIRILDINGDTVGTGFLVTERWAITCAHVVARALGLHECPTQAPTDQIQLDFPFVARGQTLTAQVVVWQPPQCDRGGDIAGLELYGDIPAGVKTVNLILADDLSQHPFRGFGFPANYNDGVRVSGTILGKTAAGWVHIEVETAYRIEPGFSGGPVWDDRLGGVVGMIIAAEARRDIKAAFMLPMDALVTAWPKLKEHVGSPPTIIRSFYNKFGRFLYIGIFLVIIAMAMLLVPPFREMIFPRPTATQNPTITLTPSHTPTITPTTTPTRTPTPSLTPPPKCPFQEDTDAETIIALIEAEGNAVLQEDLSIIEVIFAEDATIWDAARDERFIEPLARYAALFANADFLEITHFEVQPAGPGIKANVAYFISGSNGKFKSADAPATVHEFTNEKGSDHWTFGRDHAGCWVITDFTFNAGQLQFPP